MKDRFKQEERTVFLWGILGTNGTGKSVTAREVAKLWKQSRPHDDIMAFDPTDSFRGVANKFIYPHEDWYDKALGLRNALLILDEVRILHSSNIADRRLLELLSMRREYSIDIIYIVHNPKLVLEILTYYTTRYFIFYTQSRYGSFKDKMPNYAICHGASTFINKYVTRNGRGDYPNFPYMVVDNEKESINGINIDTNKIDDAIDFNDMYNPLTL